MKRDWELLFSDYDLRAVLDANLHKVNDTVLAAPADRFDAETDDLLAASVASQLVVSPLELLEDQISVAAADAKVDVRWDPNRAVFDRSQPALVDGLVVTYHLPFLGEPQLLKCQPSTYTLNPPRAVLGSSQELTFPYDQANRDIAATKPLFQQDLATLRQWISWVNQQVNEYNASLEARVRARVQQRRQELSRTTSDLASLGFAVRTPARAPPTSVPPEDPVARRKSRRQRQRREYDVALSFAGENRDYVEQVAQRLVALGVEVFYDRFEQVNLWGKDLAEHLGRVYSRDAHFVVVFASRSYAAKAWPNHEKQFALSRHLRGDVGRILPVRLDDAEVPGIPPTIGYLDARVLTPVKLAELIRQKVDSAGGESAP